MFEELKQNHYGAILADPPWQFQNLWNTPGQNGAAAHYSTMTFDDICAMPVGDLAAEHCAIFIWNIWILMPRWNELIEAWGFKYKSCAFDWIKADVSTLDMFSEPKTPQMGLGYWTRQNSEVCLLGVRGKPKRLNADVRQGIIAPRREHSRKPEGVHERIERLVAGPYLELFGRQKRKGWDVWGNQTDRFTEVV